VQLRAGSLLQSWAAALFACLRQHRTVKAEQLASYSRYRHLASNAGASKLHLNRAANSMCEGEFNMGDERNQGQFGQGQGSHGQGQQGQDKQKQQQQEDQRRRQENDQSDDSQSGSNANRSDQERKRA
jgi:hypothetical protein